MRPAGWSTSRRQLTARVLAALAAVAAAVALVASYAQRVAVDAEQFANRATAALRDDNVRSLIAQRVTDDLVLANEADLIPARPLIESATSAIVGGGAFTGLFRAAVRDVHRAVFARDQSTVTLTVADVGTVVSAALQAVQPKLAADVPDRPVPLLQRDLGKAGAALTRVVDRVRVLGVLALLATALLSAAALWLAPDRRRTIVDLGVAMAGTGVLLVVAYGVLRARALAGAETPEERAAAGAIFDAFLRDLRAALWIFAGSGAVVAAAAASLLRPVDLLEPVRRAGRRLAAEPERPALRVVRALAFVAAGVLVLTNRDAVVSLVVTAVGVLLVYAGVSALLRLVYRPPAEDAPQPVRERSRRRRPLVAGAIAALLVAGSAAAFVGGGGVTTAAPAPGACNGHEELCDKRFDQVALVATHNSMSAPLPGWYAAMQEGGIPEQLRAGVRGLLIDTHYADRLPNGRLRTDLDRKSASATQDGVSPEAVAAALRIRDRLGFTGQGERGMYLCHSFCELGGTPLGDALRQIRAFLVANPGEVLVVVNQDYVTPRDFVGAVEDAGLAELAYRGPVDGTWPTLREMVDRGQRVLFLAENEAGAAPWYHLAYERITQETPFSFRRPPQLTEREAWRASCRDNRGPDAAPLFLLNHWITTDPWPKASDARRVNAYAPLLGRARECRRLRGRMPNLVAINFYEEGDSFRVVDTLNGVG